MSSAQTYQPSLWDATPPPQAKVLDIVQGRQLRDAGIAKAELHAEQETPEWKTKAFAVLQSFIQLQHSPFMAEDVREYARLINFPQPPSNRAWGGVFVKACKEGLITKLGIQPVKNKNAHCANATLWVRR